MPDTNTEPGANGCEIFLAGIIQGSIVEAEVHPQDYRPAIREMIERHVPGAQVCDPVANYPNSLTFDDAKSERVFFHLMHLAAKIPVLLAFIPEASMGTAIEMWQARRAGRRVIAGTPLKNNYVIRSLADVILADLGELETFIRNGRLRELLADHA